MWTNTYWPMSRHSPALAGAGDTSQSFEDQYGLAMNLGYVSDMPSHGYYGTCEELTGQVSVEEPEA